MLTENHLHWQPRQSGGASTTDWCTHYLSNLSMSTSSRVSVLLLSYLCSLYDILQPWRRRGPRGQFPGLQVILWRHHVSPRFLSRAALRPVWRGVFFVVPTIATRVLLVMFKPGDRVRVNWYRKGKYYDARIINGASGGYLVQYMDYEDEFEDKVRGEDIIGR